MSWKTEDAVDVEVKRSFRKSRKKFDIIEQELKAENSESTLCYECDQACRLSYHAYDTYSADEGKRKQHTTYRRPDGTWVAGAPWKKTKKMFQEATGSAGCHLCIIIAHSFDEGMIKGFAALEQYAVLKLRFVYHSSYRDPSSKLDWEQRNRIPLEKIGIDGEETEEFWLRITTETNELGLGMGRIDLRILLFFGTPFAPDVLETRPKIHHSTGAEQNFKLASAWLKVCREHHGLCKRFGPEKADWRPSRLIQVGGSEIEPKLVVSEDKSDAVQYCALSYCWGTKESTVLTKDSLATFQDKLPMAILPSTIKEAILATRELGFEYLWVDALCIIQDSQEDWEEQSPQMSEIYGLAAVTLAAAGSPDVTQSMYRHRDPRKVRPCIVIMEQDMGRNGRNQKWVVYPHLPEKLVTNAFHNNSLSRRGWTLQERILSPRVLMFGESQMLWTCVTMEACETFPRAIDARFSTPLSELRSLASLRQRLMKLLFLDNNPSEFWNEIVQDYTTAELSRSTDKLVAIQGIATRLGTRTQAEYVAGLWKDANFLKNLLWRPRRNTRRQRPQTYRAPSWSWASIDGEILPYEEYVSWSLSNREKSPAIVRDVRVQPLDSQGTVPTGQIVDGYIDLEAYLRPCYLIRNVSTDASVSESSSYDATIISAQNRYNVQVSQPFGDRDSFLSKSAMLEYPFTDRCTLDCPEELPEEEWIDVYCVSLQLASIDTDRYEQSNWESYEGLVLDPVEDNVIRNWGADPSAHRHESNSDTSVEPNSNGGSPPIQMFRRVGIFEFHINETNRATREDALFGPKVRIESGYKGNDKPTLGRRRSRIRII